LPMLRMAENSLLLRLASLMKEVNAMPGDTIVKVGDEKASMYVIADGKVEIDRPLSVGSEQDAATRTGSRGDQFGAATLFGTSSSQRANVTAKTKCQLWRLDRDAFDAAISENSRKMQAEANAGDVVAKSDSREIFVVSDSTAESAHYSVRAALRQFGEERRRTSRTTVFRFVHDPKEVRQIVTLAANKDALIVYTLMEPKAHKEMVAACEELGVKGCDLWATLLTNLEGLFDEKAAGVSGRRQAVNDSYMSVVQAVEYTRIVDDGVRPSLWHEADIMLIGPSRAGKTPLAFYLAQQGYRVANYPLVPDEDPPEELFTIDQKKCFGLLISAERLQTIRTQRMKKMGRSGSQYADMNNIKKEISWIRTFFIRKGPTWPLIDTSNAGVMETAARIMEIMDRRKGDALAAATVDAPDS